MSRLWIAVVLLLVLGGCGGGADTVDQGAARSAWSAFRAVSVNLPPIPHAGLKHALSVSSDVDPIVAATQLFEFAEAGYPDLFPSRQGNRVLDGLIYRYYPESGAYIAVIDWRVFVLGGPFGPEVRQLGDLTDFIVPVSPPPGAAAITAATLLRCPDASGSTADNFYICMEGYLVGTRSTDATKACSLTVDVDGQVTLSEGSVSLSAGPAFGSVNFSKNDSVGLFYVLLDSPYSTFGGMTSIVIGSKDPANSDFFTAGGAIHVEASNITSGSALSCDFPVAKE